MVPLFLTCGTRRRRVAARSNPQPRTIKSTASHDQVHSLARSSPYPRTIKSKSSHNQVHILTQNNLVVFSCLVPTTSKARNMAFPVGSSWLRSGHLHHLPQGSSISSPSYVWTSKCKHIINFTTKYRG